MTNLFNLKKLGLLLLILLSPIFLISCEEDEEQLLDFNQRIRGIWIIQNYIIGDESFPGLGDQFYFRFCSNIPVCTGIETTGSYEDENRTLYDFNYEFKNDNTILNIEYTDADDGDGRFKGDWKIEKFTNNDLKLTKNTVSGISEISLTTAWKR